MEVVCHETKREVLDALDGLLERDPEAFFSLLGNCTSALPMEIREGPKERLIEMRFLDSQGVPPLVVQDTVRAVFIH